jgi:uncharacterized phage protein (TIGR02220 family)
MAKYRNTLCSIWKDADFEEYVSDQKLIFMHLFTNQSTTESGIYCISHKAISNETAISLDKVKKLIVKTKNIIYDDQSRCVFVVNFLKHNGGGRPDLLHRSILKDAETFHTCLWHLFIEKYPQHLDIELASIIENYPKPDKSLKDSISISISISKEPFVKCSETVSNRIKLTPELKDLCVKITKHLNEKAGKQYQPLSKLMIKYISARKNDGYILEQFIKVIDTKVPQWINDTKMQQYISPDTLFNEKMEKYLQEGIKKKKVFDKRTAPTYKCHICNVAHHWDDPETRKCEQAEIKRRMNLDRKKQEALKK